MVVSSKLISAERSKKIELAINEVLKPASTYEYEKRMRLSGAHPFSLQYLYAIFDKTLSCAIGKFIVGNYHVHILKADMRDLKYSAYFG